MADDERAGGRGGEQPPLATENQEMPQSETVSEFGDVRAKEEAVAIESADDPESGGVTEQRDYLRWENRISDEERDERAAKADLHNTPHRQAD